MPRRLLLLLLLVLLLWWWWWWWWWWWLLLLFSMSFWATASSSSAIISLGSHQLANDAHLLMMEKAKGEKGVLHEYRALCTNGLKLLQAGNVSVVEENFNPN